MFINDSYPRATTAGGELADRSRTGKLRKRWSRKAPLSGREPRFSPISDIGENAIVGAGVLSRKMCRPIASLPVTRRS